MKRLLVALLLAVPIAAQAQNQAAPFTFGPTVPLTKIAFVEAADEWQASVLAAGVGVSANWNLFPNWDGTIRRLTIGAPIFMRIPRETEYEFAVGLSFGIRNNLLSVGASYDLVRTADQSGLFLGNGKKSNLALLFSLGMNFGEGNEPAPSTVQSLQKAGIEVTKSRPPGYIW